jgi:hypothetical protein
MVAATLKVHHKSKAAWKIVPLSQYCSSEWC